MRTQYQRMHPCAMCKTENECAYNDWMLYDPYNKKCPNWKEGVKQYKKFMKQYRRGEVI